MSQFRPRLSAWGPALAWAATIFVLSSFPGSAYPATDVIGADKMVHLALYGLLAALCARGFGRGTRWPGPLVWIAAAMLASVYGMSDEFHQRFVPGRNSDWADVLADTIGAVLGAGAAVAVFRRRRHARSSAVR
jgi:VanZ family protein